MATTLKSNQIIPEVLADMIHQKLISNCVFTALADVDSTLDGQPGDTLSFPKFAYIGAADVTAENGEITPTVLSASKVDKKVQKYTKAVQLTDEVVNSAYGNPVEETANQLAKSIADKIDTDFITELASSTYKIAFNDSLSSDNLVDSLALFGEDIGEKMALVASPKEVAALRKDDDYINGSEIATEMLIRGTVGEIWGTQLIPSNRLNGASGAKVRKAYIVKPGALALVMKEDIHIESERDALYQRTNIVAAEHAVPYLKDESKVIEISLYNALDTVADGVVTSEAGTTASNDTFIKISKAAPVNTKWVYKLGTSAVTPTWGTALAGYTDWVSGSTEIAASSNTKACVVLVNAADSKPLAYTNIALTKKA